MHSSLSPIELLAILAIILGLAAMAIAFRMRFIKKSRIGVIVAVLPAILMLTLFYSLAMHMHQSLGAWPTSIGDRGFPAPLITHGDIAVTYFSILTLISVFVWPVVLLLCLVIRRWRVCLYYLGIYAFACFVCFGLMLLAPSQFLNWWWD